MSGGNTKLPLRRPSGLTGQSRIDDIDLSDSSRLAFQHQLLEASSKEEDPAGLIRLFVSAVQRAYRSTCIVLINERQESPPAFSVGLHVPENGADVINADDPWVGTGLKARRGGLVQQIISDRNPKLIRRLNHDQDTALGGLFRSYRSAMAVPIFLAGKIRNWLLLLSRQESAFTVPDVEEFNLRANLVGATIQHLRAERALVAAAQSVRRDVERIARLQRSLLPMKLPNIPGVQLACRYTTSDRAGGDYYDVRPARMAPDRARRHWLLLIADASGHGPAAAVLTAILDVALRARPVDILDPAELLNYANHILCAKPIGDAFITAWAGIYDSDQHGLAYACAGHNPPLLRCPSPHGRDVIVSLDDVGSMPLGIEVQSAYETGTTRLCPGQTLVLYTDGIVEAADPAGAPFSVAALKRTVLSGSGDPNSVVDRVQDRVGRHERGMRPRDDQTLLALRVRT